MIVLERIQRFLEAREGKEQVKPSQDQTINVNEAVSAVAFYYEKIRTIIDYQDEHLIRQNAIRRILGRRLILANTSDDIATGVLKELVRFRYFPNGTVPLKKIKEISSILDVYLGVLRELSETHALTDSDQDWLISMAACAIDEHLMPMTEEHALVDLMYDVLEPEIEGNITGTDDVMRRLQIYIACYRVLLRPDIDRLRAMLLARCFPEWGNTESPDVKRLAEEYKSTAKKIDYIIHHPSSKKLLPSFRRYRIPFVVFFTVIRHAGADILKDPEALEKEVVKTCEQFYAVQRKRLNSRTVRAFIYIFLTKMVLGLSVELPYDLITVHHVNTLPLLVNILFPPVLLAFMTMTVKMPTKENTKMIVQSIKEIAYPDTPKEVFVSQTYRVKRKRPVATFVFSVLYAVLFAVSFGFVGWLLHRLDFNLVSAAVFFVFFCLITFFGINLRRSIKDLIIIKPKGNFFMILIESFFLPIVQVGRWLSFNISRVNIFIFIFDVLIELPLQALLEITEEWFAFLKEKKDEME